MTGCLDKQPDKTLELVLEYSWGSWMFMNNDSFIKKLIIDHDNTVSRMWCTLKSDLENELNLRDEHDWSDLSRIINGPAKS